MQGNKTVDAAFRGVFQHGLRLLIFSHALSQEKLRRNSFFLYGLFHAHEGLAADDLEGSPKEAFVPCDLQGVPFLSSQDPKQVIPVFFTQNRALAHDRPLVYKKMPHLIRLAATADQSPFVSVSRIPKPSFTKAAFTSSSFSFNIPEAM